MCPDIQLTRAERWDLKLNRALPRATARGHRWVLRLAHGRVASSKRGIPVGLLTTTGARTGRRREVPLMYLPDDGRYVVVASNSGQDRHPGWFHNLQADPNATFTVRGHVRNVRARVVTGEERAELWPRMVPHNPLWAAFQDLTDRETPVVSLDPR
jgi:deazaflavin-dependent oxidoreductase (nitroreductase family)